MMCLARLTLGMAEHVAAVFLRVVGKRYFDAAHFDRRYRAADPWHYGTSPYEAVRREALLAALPRTRYGSVLEVGCGEGYTTRLLAGRADRIVGLDISKSAVDLARIAGLPRNIRLAQGDLVGRQLPPEAPPGAFDLVVCAEMLYYCYRLPAGPACRMARDRLVGWLAPGGDLVLLHPLHVTHYPFDRLAAPRPGPNGENDGPALIALARRRVALPPRPVTIAVYRRPAAVREATASR